MPNVRFGSQQLETLVAILRCGSFERAAHQLGITQSAVSQRLRSLEEETGATLVVRGQPCTATETGARLAAHAETVALLESNVRRDLGFDETRPTLKIAVNADSLATWFLGAIAGIDAQFELIVDDQDHSADLLRSGEVVAAVTADGEPVQGCDRIRLRPMSYLPTASPEFVERWFSHGITAASIQKAPVLIYNEKDGIQHVWAKQSTGHSELGPRHLIPSTTAYVEAATLGLGWGLNPKELVCDAVAQGDLIDLSEGKPFALPLFWQSARVVEPALAPLTRQIKAIRGLRQPKL